MYYIISLDNPMFNFVGKACGEVVSQEHAFKFTSLLHAESILDACRAKHPNACLMEVNEVERCMKRLNR